ncbi:hypothetical protein AVEN_58204-1 [Araneus ventricosus]|uniref:Reticulon-4-interacting protein 1, mitochondrial n=1 Tax=Araneus ventricosus TaxID=182803 RepID=A0A4Y2MET5_ARAVE|nr:hypothetical protein AVEN_58204-1 [Araneus ventricosus]
MLGWASLPGCLRRAAGIFLALWTFLSRLDKCGVFQSERAVSKSIPVHYLLHNTGMYPSHLWRKGVLSTCRFLHSSQKCGMKTMQAWQAFEYGSPEKLQLNTMAQIPIIKNSVDVLVKVHAASVNPLDVCMLVMSLSPILRHGHVPCEAQFKVNLLHSNVVYVVIWLGANYRGRKVLLSNSSDLNQIRSMRLFAFITSNMKSGRLSRSSYTKATQSSRCCGVVSIMLHFVQILNFLSS